MSVLLADLPVLVHYLRAYTTSTLSTVAYHGPGHGLTVQVIETSVKYHIFITVILIYNKLREHNSRLCTT